MLQMARSSTRGLGGLLAWTLLAPLAAAEAPSVEVTLKFQPRQRDVEYEIPAAADVPKCKVELEEKVAPSQWLLLERDGLVQRRFTPSSWVLLGAQGQVLRRFTDLDRNGDIELYRYYQHGIEVYREIDTNGNRKADQYRWLNLGGTRWGVDENEDGKIDSWKVLSAAEASREAVRAMTAGDDAALQVLMVTAEDLKSLGIANSAATKILEAVQNAGAKARAIVSKSKVLNAKSKWVRFDAQMPGLIPVDEGKATADLQVYENAMVVVEPGPGLVQIGELVRIGEVWKLTQVPQPIESESGTVTAGGLLMQPLLAAATGDGAVAPAPEVQKLIEELQKLDNSQPQLGAATKAQLAAYNNRRAELLLRLQSSADTEDEKAVFLKQCVDGLASAVQTDAFPEGLQRIKQLESDVAKASPKSDVLPYVVYRRIMSEHALDMRKETEPEKLAKMQKDWLAALAEFVTAHPAAEDAPDAMWQIATAEEFSGRMKEAVEWYQKLAAGKTGQIAAEKARGAIRRIESKGKPFALSGASLAGPPVNIAAYRGKAVLVFYWATWCVPCKEDLPQLRALHQQYRQRGFEVVGVCLDIPGGTRQQQAQQLQQYLTENKVPWTQIYEPGGLDSPPAVQYGIISLPTMILVDPEGKVVSRNSSVQELKTLLPQVVPGK